MSRTSSAETWPRIVSVVAVALTVMLALALSSRPAEAGDPKFGDFVKRLEREYKLQRKSIPFFWLAKAVVRVASPAGVSRLDLAIYEDQDLSSLAGEARLQERVHSFLGSGWKPFVEVHSPRSGERVLLYSRPKGKDVELFILTVERNEAVALLTRVNPEALSRAIENPPVWARSFH